MIKIALVDDDRATNFLNGHLIKSHLDNTEISTFSNGKEILESDELIDIDYIFLDINMPVMNGVEFLEKYSLLDLSNHVKIFVAMPELSNHDADALKAKFNAIDSFYSKPLSAEEILTLIPSHAK